MDCLRLLRFIEMLTAYSGEETSRYIIRFHHRFDYCQCVHVLFGKFLQGKQNDRYLTLPSISAISCKLANNYDWKLFNDMITIEEDYLLQIGSQFQLPTAGKPFSRVDTSKRIPWGLTAIQAPKLWRKTKGRGVRIGIVDTGIDSSHPDINTSVERGINLLNSNQPPTDDNGHGTHIAGTIVASNVSAGIRGVAPKATLFPVKAFDHEGAAYVSDIILAIHWCISHRMNIINMSFGMSQYSTALHQAIKSAFNHDVIIVASSGNNGYKGNIDYPARFPQTVAVGATNKDQRIAAFSNQGKLVDLYAPGEAIYSTWPHARYNELSGTSMATAHVSGVIALLLAKKPNLTVSRIKNILTLSAVPFNNKKKLSPRKGRLDAVRAWTLMCRSGLVRKKVSSKDVRKVKQSQLVVKAKRRQ
jgi:subtilisin